MIKKKWKSRLDNRELSGLANQKIENLLDI